MSKPQHAGGLFKATGKTPKVERERQEDDFERTPVEGSRSFLAAEAEHLKRFPVIWEAAAGDGAMAFQIERAGYECVKSDLVDRGCGAQVSNFYDFSEPLAPAIVTNPPFCEANWKDGKGKWITHALEELKVDYMALLLPWTWMGAQGLGLILGRHPPKRVYLMRFRLDFSGAGSPPTYCGWYVWERGYQGPMELLMMDRADPLQEAADI